MIHRSLPPPKILGQKVKSKVYCLYYRPQTKLRKGNVFTSVSRILSTGKGVSGRHPLDRLGRHPPGRQTPPPGQTSYPADGYCSGRYASYWNAFLFILFRHHRAYFTFRISFLRTTNDICFSASTVHLNQNGSNYSTDVFRIGVW